MAEPRRGRIVLGLPAGAFPHAPVESAMAVARLFGWDIETILLMDEALLTLGALPFAREFQPLLRQWREVSAERLAAECRALGERFRRQTETMAVASGVASLFQVATGEPAAILAGIAAGDDIIAFPAPARRGEEWLRPYPELCAAVLAGAFPVLILPRTLSRAEGPVMVVTPRDDDGALTLADRIARAAGVERVIVEIVDHAPDELHPPRARATTATPRMTDNPVRSLLNGLRDVGERVVVLSRRALEGLDERRLLDIVAARRTPLLIAS